MLIIIGYLEKYKDYEAISFLLSLKDERKIDKSIY